MLLVDPGEAQTVKNGASSHKTNYITICSEILNLEGHSNCIVGSKVTAILLNGWIMLLVELHWEGSAGSLRSRLVWMPFAI